MIVAGAVLALISLAGLSWYSITGPNVVSDLADVDPGGVVLLVSPDRGVQQSWVVWLLFAGCFLAALTAVWANGGVSSAGRVLAPVLAVLLIADAVARVALPGFAAGHGGLPPGTTVVIGAGFWMALAGFVLLAIGAAVGPGPAPRAPSPSAQPTTAG